MRDDLKGVLEAPYDAYHAHVLSLAAHSNQMNRVKKRQTSEKFLENPVALCFVSFPLGTIT